MSEKKPVNSKEHENKAQSKNNDQMKSSAMTPEQQAKQMEELEKIKGKLDSLKKTILKKYPFVMSLGLLPMNSFAMIEEDEGVPKEVIATKPLHLIMIIPEEKYK